MLASTMQFSSNDPSPAAKRSRASQRARSPTKERIIVPSGPNSVPDPTHHDPSSTPEGSTNDSQPIVPNSQRSTHEQPPQNIRLRRGPGPLARSRCSLERR
jgi:hypothetical protein